MQVLLRDLPSDVLGQHVLSQLDWRDFVRLDSAALCKKTKANLKEGFQQVITGLEMWSLSSSKTFPYLQWCASRGLRIRNLSLRADFGRVFSLLRSNPNLISEEPRVICNSLKSFTELQQALATEEPSPSLMFHFHLQPDDTMTFQNTNFFRDRLTGLSWDAPRLRLQDATELVRGNPLLSEIIIGKPTQQEIKLAISVGATLRSLALYDASVKDVQLALLGRECSGLTCLTLCCEGKAGSVHTGLISLATCCMQLRTVYIDGIYVSEQAVTALCAYCSKLEELEFATGRLTSAALSALCASRAPLHRIRIGWRVDSLRSIDFGAPFLSSLRYFTLASADPACTDTLAIALSHLQLNILQLGIPIPRGKREQAWLSAGVMARLVRSCTRLQSLWLDTPLRDSSEDCLVELGSGLPMVDNLQCAKTGMEFTDRVIAAVAERCPSITALGIRATEALTDAGIATLAQHCPKLSFLEIAGAVSLTDTTLQSLITYIPNLRHLTLSDSALLTEGGLQQLLEHYPDLTSLDVPDACMSSAGRALISQELQSRYGRRKR
jgi:hypothetical protein